VITAPEAGSVHAIDTEAIGHASMLLGAGRLRLDTPIDFGVGVIMHARVGDAVDHGSLLATVHFNDAARADEAVKSISRAYTMRSASVASPRLIKAVLR